MVAPSRPSLRSSTRRSLGLAESHPTGIHQNTTITPPIRRAKRTIRSSSINDDTHTLKKQRIQLDITARPKASARSRNAKDFAPAAHKPPEGVVTSFAVASPITNGVSQRSSDILSSSIRHAAIDSTTAPAVNSGISIRKQQEDKRTLRSQGGGSRLRSELSLYFPNYDEIINDEPKEPGKSILKHIQYYELITVVEFLTAETAILVLDDPPQSSKSYPITTSPINTGKTWLKTTITARGKVPPSIKGSAAGPGNIFDKLNNAQRIDFSSIERNARHSDQDPLSDTVFYKAHRRAERQEKQLRNIEKERAQHEKVQLERLLDGLKGYDWLRVMGITGITDTEKKGYEPRRDYFIQEVATLIEKFMRWKEEEKRRKLERDHALSAEEMMDGSVAGLTASVAGLSDGDPPDLGDVDAWAARQLHQEAVSATGQRQKKRRQRDQGSSASIQPLPPEQKPFLSFYSKAYLREAAIGKHRRGRSRTAFGCAIPEMPETAFQLPPDYLTEDALAASARSRRRVRRESKGTGDAPG